MSVFHIGLIVLLVGVLVAGLTDYDGLGGACIVIGAIVALVGLIAKR